ncbi:MAG: hypothetical protein J2P27_19065 [Actinobacteria bacterium]|nr:hypothetical protein [Actinomycetota bacterium]
MSKRYARPLVAAPAAVLAAVLGVTTVLAAATWTVRPGGSVSLTSGRLAVRDTRTGTVLSCTSSHVSGTLKHGGGLSGTGIGSVTSGSFTNCNGPIWLPFTLTATDLPWHVNLTSYNATTGVATGNLSHAQLKLAGPGCSAVIDGTSGTASDGIIRFTYTTSTATLKVLPKGGNLRFYNLSGCAGLFAGGDPATISGKLSVRPKQTITSP